MSEESLTTPPAISVRDITVAYGEKTVLSAISTEIVRSEIRVILGASGCGKTTLLKAMIGLLRPAKGKVFLLGSEIRDQDDPATIETLKKVGVLFQNGALLGSLTVLDNVALPLRMHTDLPEKLILEIALFKLAQVDLPHVAKLFPSELSGGMRKRVALARALALDPPLLFCDEPSAGLDPITAAGLDLLLLRLRKELGITIAVVTHELRSIGKIADTISFLHRGTLLFDGPLADARALQSGPVHDFFAAREDTLAKGSAEPVEFTVEKSQ
ncbi:MAG: ATP-binding cassette domain-containing protein [Chitinispirillaceae bacterium]|nr:ATP-binding cassette domain-containing protein [Chitinispirillaceae bacterium]